MKREILILTLLAVGLVAGGLPVAAQSTEEPPAYSKLFKNEKDMNSYAIGMNYGVGLRNIIKTQELDIDLDAAIKAFKESLTSTNLPITEAQDREILTALRTKMAAKKLEKRKLEGEANRKAGEEFMAKNKNEPGVVTTDTGLQYKVLASGTGTARPVPTDVVKVKYRGTFIDGTEFDSSAKHGGEAEFPVNQCPPGWPEALQLMTPGSKWRLFVSGKQAYGEAGLGNIIGPFQTLIFDVELISFKAAAPLQPMTSDIIKVPSAEDMKKGAQIETIKAADLEKERLKESKTNK